MRQAGSFWERRKAAVAAEAEAEKCAVDTEKRTEEIEGKEDHEVLAEMGLKDPDEMQQGDDFAAFMSRDVPEHLRKRALRTLWRSNPVLANVDGLNEYDDDYRAAMLLQKPIKTAYQVGKGMKAHIDEMARQAEARERQEDTAPEAEAEDLQAAEVEAPSQAFEPQEVVSITPDSETEVEGAQPDDVMPRRMRFRFEETTA